MRHLAIETSGQYGSLAYFSGNDLQAAEDLPKNAGTVESLATSLREILRIREPVDFISVAIGPGSFTGLRIGIMTAKMLGMAWEIPIVPVDTLEAVAWPCRSWGTEHEPQVSVPVMNAFRGQVFSAVISFGPSDQPEWLAPTQVLDAKDWQVDPLAAMGVRPPSDRTKVIVTGPGLEKYPLHATSDFAVELAEQAHWEPTARSVGLLGLRNFESGNYESASSLQPNYVRASAAEEKRVKR